MQFGVNLIPQKKVDSTGLANRRKTIIIISLILALYLVVVAALLGYSFYLASEQSRVISETRQTESKIKGLEKREILAITLKNRMKIIDDVLKNRQQTEEAGLSWQQLLLWVKELSLPGIVIGDVTIDNKSLVLNGEAENAAVVADFLDQFSVQDKRFSWVSLDSLSKSIKGNYRFVVKFNFSSS